VGADTGGTLVPLDAIRGLVGPGILHGYFNVFTANSVHAKHGLVHQQASTYLTLIYSYLRTNMVSYSCAHTLDRSGFVLQTGAIVA
jgi:hypothetical protein